MPFSWMLANTDSATDWSVLGIVSVIIGFVAPRIVYDLVQAWNRRRLLKHALLIQCIGTIRKVAPVLDDIKKTAEKDQGSDRLSFLCRFPGTITVAGISDELQQLLSLLPKDEVTNLVRLLDRWARFQLLVAKYERAYDIAIQNAAKADASNSFQQRLTDEYFIQAVKALNDCYCVGHRLCEIACKLVYSLRPGDDVALEQVSEGLWTNWAALSATLQRHSAGGAVEEFILWEPPSPSTGGVAGDHC